MTKTEAFQTSAQEGRAITHKYFDEEEFIHIMPNGEIRVDDTFNIPMWEFMKNRQSPEWDNDWSLY